jgi:class 3 adenylate cyclase
LGTVRPASLARVLTTDTVDLEDLMHRRRLGFPDELETAFRDDQFHRWLTTHRAAMAGGLLTFAAFGVVDPWAMPRSLWTVWALRFGLGCSITMVLLLLSFASGYRKIMQPGTALVVGGVGLTIAGMEIVAEPGESGHDLYIFGMVIVLFFGYTAPRLRFWYAAAVGWSMVGAALIVGVHHQLGIGTQEWVSFAVAVAFLVAANLAGMLAAYLIEAGHRRGFLQELIIRREQERSESLLLNILPAPVAERLKRGETVADAFDDVTILFADIVSFTSLSETMTPTELVRLLNHTFSTFDRLAMKHGLEKIKTIGDSYMVVGGLPSASPDSAARVADMALDLQQELKRIAARFGRGIRVRAGMHTGAVVAGVIGLHKFSYDLWGDAVNIASRMETQGEPGRIQVSATTFERLRSTYAFEGPRPLSVRGKGTMTTYFLVRRRSRSGGAAEPAHESGRGSGRDRTPGLGM